MQKIFLILLLLTLFRIENIFCALSSYQIDMRILVLSTNDDETNDFGINAAKKFLLNFGIPFDYINLKNKNEEINFLNDDGSAKYYGIVTTTNEMDSALLEKINAYQRNYNVRRVSLYSTPNESIGVRLSPVFKAHPKTYITLEEKYTKYQKGLVKKSKIPVEGIWYYPTEITNPTLAKPVAYFADNSIAAVEVIRDEEISELHLFFQPASFARVNIVFSNFWIQWLTRNMYVGARRIYLTAQVDDWFLANNLWNPETESQTWNGVYTYRVTNHDVDAFIAYRDKVLRPLSLDPNYKIELAFNGYGVKEHGGEDKDELYIKSQELKNEFYWVSHTFSHFNLDHLTYDKMVTEIRENVKTAKNLLSDAWDSFTENAIVTPEISGLFNPEVLKALKDEGIDYVIGDNSIEKLVPKYPHIGKYTTQVDNGFDGLFIIPRNAIEVDFDLSLPIQMESQFNKMNDESNSDKLDLKSIMEKISITAANDLLNYDHAPFMFHQANLRFFNYENSTQSLMTLWLTQVMLELRKYSELPILSAQYKELIRLYKNRMNFDQCKANVRLNFNEETITEVIVTGSESCTIPITGLELNQNQEIYGPDSTDYITVSPNEKTTLTFFPNRKRF